MIASGSTMMSSAAFVAVDRAIPQCANAKAPANPKTPIHAIRQASPRASVAAPGRARLNGTRMPAPIISRISASSAGGTSSRAMRVAT